MKHHLPVTEGT